MIVTSRMMWAAPRMAAVMAQLRRWFSAGSGLDESALLKFRRTAIPKQHVEPGIELALDVKPGEASEGIQERLLRRICSAAVVANERPGVGQRACLVTVNQVPECLPVAREALPNGFNVVHVSESTIRQEGGVFTWPVPAP